jgi:hypothetical protein
VVAQEQSLEEFMRGMKYLYETPSSQRWKDLLVVACEPICATHTSDCPWRVTIYGASPEAQERLENCRMVAQEFIYRPMEEAEKLGLKPGELRIISP